MKITGVRFLPLRCPLAKPVPFSLGTMTHRQFALVIIDTDEGIQGVGETSVNFPGFSVWERKATVEEGIRPLLVGENPLQIEYLWHKMVEGLRRLGLQWGAPGPMMQAIAGADIALWDIAGKAMGQPVYQLLGGAWRTRIPCYATGLDPSDIETSASRAVEQGFRAIKLRVGFHPDRDVELVRRARSAVGDGVEILIDANQAWEAKDALAMVDRLLPFNPGWLEEPVRVDDHEGWRQVRRAFPGRLAGGENHFELHGYRALLDQGYLDVIMPDVARAGGITGVLKILSLARAWGVDWSLHSYGSDVGLAASLHIMAALPGGYLMLKDVSDAPARSGILVRPIQMEGGDALVPQGPGLGVELSPEGLARWRWDAS